MPHGRSKLGVILVNLGTPDEPSAPAIRRYLDEFLSDPRVVDIPRLLWLPILKLIILNVRPKKLVHNYDMIWGKHDGPIRNITRALARRVDKLLTKRHGEDIRCNVAMTYGQPSIEDAVLAHQQNGIDEYLFLPLYPQYAGATTGAVFDAINRTFKSRPVPDLEFIPQYHDHPRYIHALTKSIEPYHNDLDNGTHLVFSFHGLPEAQVRRGDPYAVQCSKTTQMVVHQLGLDKDQWSLTYQSRFGPAKWLTPYTIDTMAELPKRGKKKILVVCPGFATDCLETLEEIKIQNRDVFMAAGGESFRYVRALNASADHASVIYNLIEENLEYRSHSAVASASSSTSTGGS